MKLCLLFSDIFGRTHLSERERERERETIEWGKVRQFSVEGKGYICTYIGKFEKGTENRLDLQIWFELKKSNKEDR